MNIPDQIRIRILFKTGENEYRKFYWFEMKDNELYWGQSTKAQHHIAPAISDKNNSLSIKIPKNFDEFEKEHQKFSFHKSGQVHSKRYSEKTYQKLSIWGDKETIIEPKRFFIVTTKTIQNYQLYTKKNLTANNTNAQIIGLSSKTLEKRLYIEFYLSPVGQFKPKPTLLFKQLETSNHFYQLLSKDLMLVGVLSILNIENDVGLDMEISFIPTDI